MINRTLSHFRILEKLGAGGMGVVYKAEDLRLSRLVALKVLPRDKVSDPERRRRFVQEAKAASALNHPNIVTIYDIDEAEGEHFIAMEYVAGRTLTELIGRKGMPLKDVLQYAIQMADALGKAHAAGIVHRDLKPANLMVTDDGLVKILDFGLAKLAEPAAPADEDSATMSAEAPVTEAGKILGTVAYMSPEQAEGKSVDSRSDIFSLGSVLYEMLTGRRPFAGETSASTMAAIITRDPAPIGEISHTLPVEIERAVMRCLRKEPQRRIQTMSDLKVLLQDLKEDSESGRLSAARAPAPRQTGRIRRVAVPAAAVLVAAAAIAAWFWFRPPRDLPALRIDRLTYESGTAIEPAISADGKLIAYASSATGAFDIYVRQLGGQQAIRRTQHEAIDRQPSFSPDGSKIVFRSEREGGGIYVMDTLIGPERKIADGGRFARFSPDGTKVLYLVGSPLLGRAKIFLVSSNGGSPQAFQTDFWVPSIGGMYNSPPLWSPDGSSILFDGMRLDDPRTRDWWVAPVAGGDAVRVGAPSSIRTPTVRICFAWRGNYVYYAEGTAIGGMGLCRVPLGEKPPWRVAGRPEILTDSAGMIFGAAASADGRIVFSMVEPVVNIWGIRLQGNKSVGTLQAITEDSSNKLDFAVDGDGSRLAYSFFAPPNQGIRIRDLASGHEDQVDNSHTPRLSRDGRLIAYGNRAKSYVAEIGAPVARQVCERCLVQGVFADRRDVLVDYGDTVARQGIASGRAVALMETKGLEITDISMSPGERWLAFTLPRADLTAALYVSPVGPQATRRDSWTLIAEDRNYLGSPAWSPDSKVLFYVSNRDDFRCVWAQRIAADGRPDGAPFGAYHDHKAPPSAMLMGFTRIAVTEDKLYMLMGEARGNLWSVTLNR